MDAKVLTFLEINFAIFKSTAHLEAQFVSEKCGTLSIYIVKCNLNNYFVIMIAPK